MFVLFFFIFSLFTFLLFRICFEIRNKSEEIKIMVDLQIEVCGNYIIASLNHVMEDEHNIEWLAIEGNGTFGKKTLRVGEVAKAIFPYIKGGVVYAFCNKHGLWSKTIN